jgi:hypothetical protein
MAGFLRREPDEPVAAAGIQRDLDRGSPGLLCGSSGQYWAVSTSTRSGRPGRRGMEIGTEGDQAAAGVVGDAPPTSFTVNGVVCT